MNISIKDIKVVQNYRKNNNEIEQQELNSSVKQHGILVPVTVAKTGKYYTLIAGWRRYMAAKAAGLESIPANVLENTGNIQILQLTENLQRRNPDLLDEAQAVANIVQANGIEYAASVLHKPTAWIHNRVLIDAVIPEIKELFSQNKITKLQLLRLSSATAQEQQNAIEHGVQSRIIELSSAPFDLTKPYGSRPACEGCQYNTASSRLFDEAPSCLMSQCHRDKMQEWTNQLIAETVNKGKRLVLSTTSDPTEYGLQEGQYIILTGNQWASQTTNESEYFSIRQNKVVNVTINYDKQKPDKPKAADKKAALDADPKQITDNETVMNVLVASIKEQEKGLSRFIEIRAEEKRKWLLESIPEEKDKCVFNKDLLHNASVFDSICHTLGRHSFIDKVLSVMLFNMSDDLLREVMNILHPDKLQLFEKEQEDKIAQKKHRVQEKVKQMEAKLAEIKSVANAPARDASYPKLIKQHKSQMLKMHEKHPDAIFLMEVDGYYLSIADDATAVSKISKRPIVDGVCGFPVNELDIIMPKIIKSGRKVATITPLEEPKKRNANVQRKKTN